MTTSADPTAIEIPERLASAHDRAHQQFVEPGTSLDGATRRAIVEESRASRSCALCLERRVLSYAAVDGEHTTVTDLDAAIVELVHRGVTDPGRLTKGWANAVMAGGVSEAAFVEIAGLVGTSTIADTLATAFGDGPRALAAAEDGEPSGELNEHVVDIGARVRVMDNAHPLPGWDGRWAPNIGRALALVPGSIAEFWGLFSPHYMPLATEPADAMQRPQIEFVASRTSALNECFY